MYIPVEILYKQQTLHEDTGLCLPFATVTGQ